MSGNEIEQKLRALKLAVKIFKMKYKLYCSEMLDSDLCLLTKISHAACKFYCNYWKRVCVRYVALGNLNMLIMWSSASFDDFPYEVISSSFKSKVWQAFSIYLRMSVL